jgi:O-antigen/teichoic acid export membrane protein
MIGHKPLTLRRNLSWTLVGNMTYAACQWGMLVVLARLGNPEMVGQLALGLAITAPIMLFANMSLRQVQATDARHEYSFGDYLGLRLSTTSLAILVVVAVVFAAGYRWETALIILAVGVAKAFESVSDIFYGLFQQRERMDFISKSMVIRGFLSLAALGLGLYATGSVFWGVVGMAAVWASIMAVYDVRNGTRVLRATAQAAEPVLRIRWNTRTLTKLLYIALPMSLVAALISFNINIPRYFVERYLGEGQLGIFAALAYLMIAGNTVMMALAQSSLPRLSKHYSERDASAFHALLWKLLLFGAGTGVVGIGVVLVAGTQILGLLYGPEYAAHSEVLVWLMVAASFQFVAVFLNHGIWAVRRFRVLVPGQVVVTATMILGSVFAIPVFGLVGAAWVFCLGMIVQVIIRAVILISVTRTAFMVRKPL